MNKLIAMLALVAALTACDKADKDKKNEPAPKPEVGGDTKPTPDKVAPDKVEPDKVAPDKVEPTPPTPPADPFASWTEHKGPGFVVTAPRAPNTQQQTADTPAGPQPVTFLLGYEPAGFEGAFQAAISDVAAIVKDTADIDPKQLVDDGVKGMLANVPGVTVQKDEVLPGDDFGRAIMASGNHPQGGPFQISAKMFFRNGKIYMVQALHADPNDAAAAAKFVDSFKFVD